MAPTAAAGSRFSSFADRLRQQSTNIQAAVLWGGAAGTAAIYLVQPFDWLRKTFFEKPEPEEK